MVDSAPFVVLFCIAWLLPAISPSVSASMWKEQTAPQTKVGQANNEVGLLAWIGRSWELGASAGMALTRTGEPQLPTCLSP